MTKKKFKLDLWGKPQKITPSEVVLHIFLGWLFAVALEILRLPKELRAVEGLAGLAAMSFGRIVGSTIFSALLLTFFSRCVCFVRLERIGVLCCFALCAGLSLSASFTKPFLWFCILLMGILAVYCIFGWNSKASPVEENPKKSWPWLIVTGILAGVFVIFVSAWTVGRYLTFSAPTYDFGIFAQMFYSMKETGLPMTTVERDGLLSHFAVHVSPIYYLMLPFYALFPSPATLQVLQAVVLASAVIPLWKIGKHHGLSAWIRTLLCALLLLYPALSGGTSYDIHENCFLAPLVLWVLYGVDRRSIPITAVSAVLLLMVKEDAAMYVAVIALYVILRSLLHLKKGEKDELKGLAMGGVMFAVSLVWFFIVTGYLAKSGDGVMTYRYNNFMYDGSASLMAVVKSVFINPMKALFECVDAEKLKFIGLTMLPLLGLPLITRRYERYILLIPYILVNLMSDYQYQHDVFFQYTFGSTACLMYLTAVNLADLKLDRIRVVALASAIAIAAGCFGSVIYPAAIVYPKRAMEKAEYYESVREVLDTIPEGVSVTTTSIYTAYLSDREILYDVRHSTKEHVLETEYMVLSKSATYYKKYDTDGKSNGYTNFIEMIKKNGYQLVEKLDGVLEIYRKPNND